VLGKNSAQSEYVVSRTSLTDIANEKVKVDSITLTSLVFEETNSCLRIPDR
jgi:hypothetical protein